MAYSKRRAILGADTSNLTGTPILVADYRQLAVSVETSTGLASRFTFIGTNEDGLTSALGTPSATVNAGGWSHVTAITVAGLYVLDTGFRWLNAIRPAIQSGSSNATITIQARS